VLPAGENNSYYPSKFYIFHFYFVLVNGSLTASQPRAYIITVPISPQELETAQKWSQNTEK